MTRKNPPKGATPCAELDREVDRLVATRLVPAGVVVTKDLEIVQFRGRTGDYLEPAPGQASLNVLKMAREGLGADLGEAIQTARRNRVAVRKERVAVRYTGGMKAVDIEVIPIRSSAVMPPPSWKRSRCPSSSLIMLCG